MSQSILGRFLRYLMCGEPCGDGLHQRADTLRGIAMDEDAGRATAEAAAKTKQLDRLNNAGLAGVPDESL
jgi:hypothetical protein